MKTKSLSGLTFQGKESRKGIKTPAIATTSLLLRWNEVILRKTEPHAFLAGRQCDLERETPLILFSGIEAGMQGH